MKRNNDRRRRWRKNGAALLACVLITTGGFSVSAMTRYYQQPTVHTRARSAYSEVPMSLPVLYGDMEARLIDGTTYVPLRHFCEAMAKAGGTPWDLTITFQASTRTATVKTSRLTMTAADGSYYIVANDRYLYHSHPAVILDDDRLYVPVRLLEEVYGVSVEWNALTRSVTVIGTPRILEHGSTYYSADQVYWLARIISAEARGEPFLGQIAVGNVVLNRLRSSAYPNTIYGVIFDRKFGVQFAPTENGTIYMWPTADAVRAAKICLDGFTISDDMLYFYEPKAATSQWLAQNRSYLFNIGAHRFYQ